jgi:hypothetical protein
MRTLKEAGDETVNAKIQPYFNAVGRVVHAWNQLQEALGQLFATIVDTDYKVVLAVWYSSKADRAQHEMLIAAINESDDDRWPKSQPDGKNDLLWLVNRTRELASKRNEAVHAPIAMVVGEGKLEIVPSYFFGHPLAEGLKGKDLLQELDWCERWATALRNFADEARAGLKHAKRPWPIKPTPPNRSPRKKLGNG